MISATVTGNVGKDAVKREHDGNTVLSFSLASRRYDSKAKEDVTDWVDVSLWGKRGEKLAQYITKGSRIAARGSLYMREYDHEGQKRHALTLRADDVELLGSKDDKKPAAQSNVGDDEIPF